MSGLPSVSVEGLLWAAAGLVAAWIFVPLLFMTAGLTRVRFRILGGPETLEPAGGDPRYEDLFERLRDLGFVPLGSRREIAWFANQHWYKAYPPGRIFAAPAGDCFVTLFRIFEGQPWRLSFHTVFSDGSLVSTANQMPDFRIDLPGYYRWGSVTPDLGELLRRHQETAENYRADHRLAVASLDLQGLCEKTARHTERFLRFRGPSMGLHGLTAPLLVFGLLGLMAGFDFGFNHWAMPAAFLLAGVLYKALRRATVRDAARNSWEQDQERALAEQWRRSRQGRRPYDSPPSE